MKALDEILVLIPDDAGPQVCSIGDLLRCIEQADESGGDLNDAIENASIDSVISVSIGPSATREMMGLLTRIHKSNAAPDFCYWEPEPSKPPFTFRAGGYEYEMVDPADVDPADLQPVIVAKLIAKGDIGRLARNITPATLQTVLAEWRKHYRLA